MRLSPGGIGGLVAQSCPTLATPWTVACRAPLSMGFSRQEYFSGLPFPSPGYLPDPESQDLMFKKLYIFNVNMEKFKRYKRPYIENAPPILN